VKRFVFVAALGQVALMSGHISLSLGLYPGRLASIGHLAQGCGVLVVGTAVFASGLLGIAQAYERAASKLGRLLPIKQMPANGEAAVSSQEDLNQHHGRFWNAYQRSAAAICLFLAGVLGLTVALSHSSLRVYLSGVGGGIVVLGAAAACLGCGGLRRMRRAHVSVEQTADTLDGQPDLVREQPVVTRRRHPAYTLFRNHTRRSSGSESRRSPVRAAPRAR